MHNKLHKTVSFLVLQSPNMFRNSSLLYMPVNTPSARNSRRSTLAQSATPALLQSVCIVGVINDQALDPPPCFPHPSTNSYKNTLLASSSFSLLSMTSSPSLYNDLRSTQKERGRGKRSWDPIVVTGIGAKNTTMIVSSISTHSITTQREESFKEVALASKNYLKLGIWHESKFIDRIVQKIWSKFPSKNKVEEEDLGLSGIGKSTLAREVYRQIKDQFEVAYFLDEIGEASKEDGLKGLQQCLLSGTLGVKDLQIANDTDGIALMKTRLRSRRVLLVLDDVDSSEQLEALAGSHEWFGPGSRIIITTKDRKLLVEHNEVQIHEASLLDYVEATKLLCWKAFNDMCPAEDFMELSVQVIKYCGRLPLALEVLGSALRGENLDFWKALLEKLRKVGPDGNILKKLKIGFDGLEESLQNSFLDIACFFEGLDKERVTRILDSSYASIDTRNGSAYCSSEFSSRTWKVY
ncbi:hypothetical protein LguiA_007288 [Lonicera macranthoides]